MSEFIPNWKVEENIKNFEIRLNQLMRDLLSGDRVEVNGGHIDILTFFNYDESQIEIPSLTDEQHDELLDKIENELISEGVSCG